MQLKFDRQITISTAGSRFATKWIPQVLTVGQLWDRLSETSRGTETYAEYQKMKKADQDRLKDVGGFVGGTLQDGRRKADKVLGRDIISLDFDNIPPYGTEQVLQMLGVLGMAWGAYTTRKHCAAAPRLRILFPLDRTVTADEYEPIARKLAQWIGINMADPTTFQAVRLMYWPSSSLNGEYLFQYGDAPLASADMLLGQYRNWKDFSEWPEVPGAVAYQALAVRQGEPTDKPGLVGAFCRVYDIYGAMEEFLPGIYEEAGSRERYTYLKGSTSGGAVVYDQGKFLFSHHATDPCSNHLVNAFDLVRLHKFGHLDDDDDPRTAVNSLPSFKAMCELTAADHRVADLLVREQREQAQKDFADIVAEDQEQVQPNIPKSLLACQEPVDDNWTDRLQKSEKTGQVLPTMQNIRLILENDPGLRGRFGMNTFAGRFEVLGSLPWNPSAKRRFWSDPDLNGLYYYLESAYKITKRTNIDSALDVFGILHAFNEVQDYLKGLKWDEMPRLETMFIEYLGADDTTYTRAVTRKAFAAAVARAMNPGCKYDQMLILCGPQGIGKSTILDKMSRGWFNDSIRSFEGKDASELLQGVWIVEIAELDAFRRSDVSRIKQFLSLRVDRYRAAYGRNVKDQPRCCIFFGTCNEDEFLMDKTGNRRFWPVDVGVRPRTKSVFTDLSDEIIDQLWAEAYQAYKNGEDLYLTGALEEEARSVQEDHRITSGQEGIIQAFLEQPVPRDWSLWDLDKRKIFWASGVGAETRADGQPDLVPRDRVCAREIWCEVFRGLERDMKPADKKEIDAILSRIPGWVKQKQSFRCGKPYGNQRGFLRARGREIPTAE